MKYICAQPAIQYFGWQIDVMLYSYVTTGVNLEDVHIVCAIQNEIDPYFDKLMVKYPGVTFSYYEDTRSDKSYISSIRPHILAKHFKAFSYLSKEEIFYHDCDIVFTKPFSIKNKQNGTCYLSDTVSYIGYNYIKSKGDDVLNAMLDIVGIDEKTVKLNQDNSGGAQYLIHQVDQYFWRDVEKDCVRLYKEISELNEEKKKQDSSYHEIQIWCADMWAVLWNLWKRNKETLVTKDMDFSWATSNINQWHKNSIYHNAGVTDSNSGMFYKGMYINNMPDLNLSLDNSRCSHNYYKMLQQSLL